MREGVLEIHFTALWKKKKKNNFPSGRHVKKSIKPGRGTFFKNINSVCHISPGGMPSHRNPPRQG